MDGKTASTSDAATGLTRESLLGLIGHPANDRLRELWKLLTYHSYSQSDLEIMRKEILASLSARAMKHQADEKDEDDLRQM